MEVFSVMRGGGVNTEVRHNKLIVQSFLELHSTQKVSQES